LAPVTFAGISAFVVAELSMDHGWPFPWPVLAGALAATAVGLVVALPALRIRGVNLAIITLAFAVTADRFLFANENINNGIDQARVNGPDWIDQTRAVRYELFGVITVGDGKQPNPMTAMFLLAVVVLACYVVVNLRRSATGRRMMAVRSNERAAAGSGVNVGAIKVVGFGMSAFIAGVGGAAIAYRTGVATPSRFSYEQSLALFAFAYLGGITRVSGAIVGGLLVTGGVLLTIGEELLGIPDEFGLLLAGLGVILTTILNPEGIAATIGSLFDRTLGRTAHLGGAPTSGTYTDDCGGVPR
ncbi:MAG: branched-chain amino acid ABC transporter permease, partial [Acidimicrobiia bacterium]|nr:branched-chain amino acid ABC transporter permease [Acidimicrobiia bacterium]